MEYIKLIFKGIVLGVANVIPGVSGGTMAVVFNVYDKIIDLICPNIKKILKAWKFWLPLAIGMGIGILAFSKIITILLTTHPIPTTFFFVGLILGSIPLIFRKMKEVKCGTEKNTDAHPAQAKRGSRANVFFSVGAFNLMHIVSFIIGLFLVLSMLIFGGDVDSAKESAKMLATSTEQVMTLSTGILLFVAGAAAAIAMIIPGISGSFLLLALGMYGTIMAAISRLDVIFLLPFAFGVLAGLIFGAALVRFLMKKIPSYTYATILGLVLGSIIVIFPNVQGINLITILISIAMVLFGFSAAFISSKGE